MTNFIQDIIWHITYNIRKTIKDGLSVLLRALAEIIIWSLIGATITLTLAIIAHCCGQPVNITPAASSAHRQMYPRSESWDREYRREYRIETSRPHR